MYPDRIAALVSILGAHTDIAALVTEAAAVVSPGVYGGELPKDLSQEMPVGAIVLKYSGGVGEVGGGYLEYSDRRIDVLCYAATVYEANRLHERVWNILKQLRRESAENTLIHWAISSGGPLSLRDVDTGWPLVFSSWQVMAAEVAVL